MKVVAGNTYIHREEVEGLDTTIAAPLKAALRVPAGQKRDPPVSFGYRNR